MSNQKNKTTRMKHAFVHALSAVWISAFAGLLLVPTSQAETEPANTASQYDWAVQVLAYREDELLNQVSGLIAGEPPVVLTVKHALRDANKLVIELPGGVQVPAELAVEDSADDLAVLRTVSRLPIAPFLTIGEVTRGDTVTTAGYWQQDLEPSRGFRFFAKAAPEFLAERVASQQIAVGVVQNADSSMVTHVTPIGRGGYGSPLINRCGEVIAINVPQADLDDTALWSRHKPATSLNALPSGRIRDLLDRAGVSPKMATAPCLGAEQQAEADALAAKQAKKEAAEEREKAKRAAEEARKKAAAAEKEAEEAKKRAEETDKQKKQLQEDAAKNAESLAKELDQEREVSAKSESLLEQQKSLIIAVVCVAVVIIVVITMALRKRKRALSASVAELNELTAPKPDYVLTGQDSAGSPVALRIFGSDLHQSPNGMLIGRNPSSVQIVLADPTVSRVHAKLSIEQGKLQIEDYGSSVGTQLNGQALNPSRPYTLANGDELFIGEVRLQLTVEEPRQ